VWPRDDRSRSAGWYFGDDNEIAFGFGGAYWADRPGLDPDIDFPTEQGFGSIQSWGVGFDLSYHHRVVERGDNSLWLGGRFGVQGWEERQSFRVRLPSGEVIDDDVSTSVVQFTLSARAEHDFGGWSGFVGAGGGYYELQINEEEDFWGGTDELADDGALGGFLSFGFDFDAGPNVVLRLENLVHFVHFDGLDEFTPGEDTLTGPFNVVQLAIVGRF
jgi:hypothetical protein